MADTEEDEEERPLATGSGGFKEAFLAEVRRSKVGFYQMTVAQAQRIDVQGDRVVFEFTPVHRLMRDQLEQNRAWLDSLRLMRMYAGDQAVPALLSCLDFDADWSGRN